MNIAGGSWFDFLKQAVCPSGGSGPWGSHVASQCCQAGTTGLWASAGCRRLGSQQEALLLGVALTALAATVLGPSGGAPAWGSPNTATHM